jgi:hypothetical protein
MDLSSKILFKMINEKLTPQIDNFNIKKSGEGFDFEVNGKSILLCHKNCFTNDTNLYKDVTNMLIREIKFMRYIKKL